MFSDYSPFGDDGYMIEKANRQQMMADLLQNTESKSGQSGPYEPIVTPDQYQQSNPYQILQSIQNPTILGSGLPQYPSNQPQQPSNKFGMGSNDFNMSGNNRDGY